MTDIARSRALVRLDGPGHIMPVEPVTPPDSRVWRVIHLPMILAIVAAGLLFVAALAIAPLGMGFRSLTHVPGARYLLPLIGAAVTIALYCLFVRVVERRSYIEELGTRGWLKELGLGLCGGLALSFATFAILLLCGGLRIVGFNPPEVMVLPLVVQLSTAIILEIVVCGLGFRLVERLLGTWLSLLLLMIFFGALRLIVGTATPLAVFAVALEAGLLFAVLYVVTRRLWAAIGLNAAWKFAQIAFYGNAMTTGGQRGFVLSSLEGPDWLTGGYAGADASIPAIALAALVVLALLVVAVRRGQIVRPVWQRGRITQPF
jgi:membrane protease YdiL (CAAX protease family)